MIYRAWQVLQRPAMPGRDPDVVLVKDGICWPALFVPVLWGLYRQQWLFVLAVLGVSLLLLIAALLGLDPVTEGALTLLVNVAAALFANDWRTWRLEAERRWFLELADEAAVPANQPRKPWLPLLDGA